MFRSTLVGKFHQRRLRWTKSLHASGVPDGFPGGFGSLSNAVIHSYSPPFEAVQRATLPISSFFQALGEAWLGFRCRE
jgi:hypothetical protein